MSRLTTRRVLRHAPLGDVVTVRASRSALTRTSAVRPAAQGRRAGRHGIVPSPMGNRDTQGLRVSTHAERRRSGCRRKDGTGRLPAREPGAAAGRGLLWGSR